MLLTILIFCLFIQFTMAYFFALGQVRLDSQYMWMERSVILSFTSNILIVYALIQSGVAPYLDHSAFTLLWGIGAIIPIALMYLTYKFWINYKLLVRNGYIKIYFFIK